LEVLKHTYSGVNSTQLDQVNLMLKKLFIPIMETFYNTPAYTNGNWGPIVTKAYMAAGIYFDDCTMFDKGVSFHLKADDNGSIRNYISGETGQLQESGRDQGHCMLGIGALSTVCEVAWTQHVDLYSALDNRLMLGYEYVSKYNLGYDVPFTQWTDVTGKYSSWDVISADSRGSFHPVFEIAYNHYVRRMGLTMPYTLEVLEQIRPEGYDRDQPSFGILIFA
jgi:hypothetical protein